MIMYGKERVLWAVFLRVILQLVRLQGSDNFGTSPYF